MTDPTPTEAPLILVVDEVADSRNMYSLYLSNHGFRVVEAANGEDAIRLAHEQQPALVLMDLGLPKMDGWEATRRIKADPRTRDVPVLAISGHAFADSVKRAKDAGVEAFFIKPCLPATVLAKINEMLRLGHSFWCYRVRDEFTPWREVAALWGLLSVRDHLILGCGVNEIQEALSTPHTDRLELLGSVGAVQ